MNNITGTIITDCHDDPTRARQEVRFTSLFGVKPTFVGVESYSAIQAAGSLVDVLNVLTQFPLANQDNENIVLVNAAPRGEDIKERWDNGTPFCYFRLGKTLVVSTYEGHCLALARDLGIIHEVQLMDIPTVTAAAVAWGDVTKVQAERINHTQFRSLEFLPLAAYWLWQGKPVPSQAQSIDHLPSAKGQVWHIDNFGNAKTTLTSDEVDFAAGKQVRLGDNLVATCYNRLADVPKDQLALTVGSSGYGKHHFLELAIGHRGRAADKYELSIGSPITFENESVTV